MTSDDEVMRARALVLHDLEATGIADPTVVSLLEEAVASRRWWVTQWAKGSEYVAGLVAQDVQDELLESKGRSPLCPTWEAATPALYIHPEIGGPGPVWICEHSGKVVAPLGRL